MDRRERVRVKEGSGRSVLEPFEEVCLGLDFNGFVDRRVNQATQGFEARFREIANKANCKVFRSTGQYRKRDQECGLLPVRELLRILRSL